MDTNFPFRNDNIHIMCNELMGLHGSGGPLDRLIFMEVEFLWFGCLPGLCDP